MKKLIIFIILGCVLHPTLSLGEDLFEKQLNRGIRNSDEYAHLLIQKSRENKTETSKDLEKALLYAPDLPEVYFALAHTNFALSYSEILRSVDFVVQGLDAYSRNFRWAISLSSAIFFALVLSFIFSGIIIVGIRLSTDLSLLAHDIRESRSTVFLLVILTIVSFFSPLWFMAGVLILLGLYMRRLDKVVVYLFLLTIICSPVLLDITSFFITSMSSGQLKAIVTENESRGNQYALAVLKNKRDRTSQFTYALALKREGLFGDASAIYDNLINEEPSAKGYVNLGNCHVGLYNFDETQKFHLEDALAHYTSAVNMKPLASAYYNLSEISREMLDFAKGDEYFTSALSIDRGAVSAFRATASRHPNRIVMDETLGFGDFIRSGIENNPGQFTFGLSVLPAKMLSLGSILLLIAFFLLDKKLPNRAFRCRKCNAILCTRCDKSLTWGQMCPQCYRSLIKLDELDVRERVARLLSIYDQQAKRSSILKVLAFIMPGAAHIYAGRILPGFLLLWPFLFLLSVPGVILFFVHQNPLIFHGFVMWTALCLAGFYYGIVNLITRKRINKGWR